MGQGGACLCVWGVGCVLFEVQALFPLFPGKNELDQIHKIHKVLGTPSAEKLDQFRKHASHMEIKAISFQSDDSVGLTKAKELGIDNMKRIIPLRSDLHDLNFITDHLEYKTSWHPIGF